MTGIKTLLEELNYIDQGNYTDDEFRLFFGIPSKTDFWKMELDKTAKIAKFLDVEHGDLVINLINLANKKQPLCLKK